MAEPLDFSTDGVEIAFSTGHDAGGRAGCLLGQLPSGIHSEEQSLRTAPGAFLAAPGSAVLWNIHFCEPMMSLFD